MLLVAGMVWLAWRGQRFPGGVATAVAVLAVLVGVANLVQVYRVGDSGARAAWGDQVTATASR